MWIPYAEDADSYRIKEFNNQPFVPVVGPSVTSTKEMSPLTFVIVILAPMPTRTKRPLVIMRAISSLLFADECLPKSAYALSFTAMSALCLRTVMSPGRLAEVASLATTLLGRTGNAEVEGVLLVVKNITAINPAAIKKMIKSFFLRRIFCAVFLGVVFA